MYETNLLERYELPFEILWIQFVHLVTIKKYFFWCSLINVTDYSDTNSHQQSCNSCDYNLLRLYSSEYTMKKSKDVILHSEIVLFKYFCQALKTCPYYIKIFFKIMLSLS